MVGMPPAMRGDSVPPEACIHVPLAALPVAFPKARFMQASCCVSCLSCCQLMCQLLCQLLLPAAFQKARVI
jgi:hypothetical protein